jgi:hypothetical protein
LPGGALFFPSASAIGGRGAVLHPAPNRSINSYSVFDTHCPAAAPTVAGLFLASGLDQRMMRPDPPAPRRAGTWPPTPGGALATDGFRQLNERGRKTFPLRALASERNRTSSVTAANLWASTLRSAFSATGRARGRFRCFPRALRGRFGPNTRTTSCRKLPPAQPHPRGGINQNKAASLRPPPTERMNPRLAQSSRC